MTEGVAAGTERSTFVTVVAWVFIAIAGFATLITALQNVMIFMFFPMEDLRQAPLDDPALAEMPGWTRLMITHMELWFLFWFLMTALTLIAAIGLLRRRNWARLLFVGILAFGVLWNVASPFLASGMMSSDDFAGAGDRFAKLFLVMQVFTVVLAVGMAVLFGWIAWRLCTPAIRAEFVRE